MPAKFYDIKFTKVELDALIRYTDTADTDAVDHGIDCSEDEDGGESRTMDVHNGADRAIAKLRKALSRAK